MDEWVAVLLQWFKQNARMLPWRRYRDWYRVLVAEVMLVRTRSEVISRVYEEFLATFPSPEDLCRSRVDDVESFFRRLGLVQRARRLREAVCTIVERFGGVLPCNYSDLIALPGVGRYIANVLLTRVCGTPTPFVDTNIARFVKRFLGLQSVDVGFVEDWLKRSASREVLEDLNIALLDLAGLVCKSRKPLCHSCPLRRFCNFYLSISRSANEVVRYA